jgi:sugar/nucleoside kinase (ribokinase family)
MKTADRPPKIAVIGTINRDTVIRANGSRYEGYGGILYNLAVLSPFAPKGYVIAPVVNIGRDCLREIGKRLAKIHHLDTSAIRIVDRKNNHCLLRYADHATKTEVLHGWVGGVSRRQLECILDARMILVNFISGSDTSGKNLRWLRDNFLRQIYMDFHSRTLGRRADGTRFLRRPRDWREYLACADIVQMNEVEFELLSGANVSGDSCRKFFLTQMPDSSCLVVTLGAEGCIIMQRKGKGAQGTLIQSKTVSHVIDTTGCGDIFSAAFISRYVDTGDPIVSACFANQVAGARCLLGDVFGRDMARLLKGRFATSDDILRSLTRNI